MMRYGFFFFSRLLTKVVNANHRNFIRKSLKKLQKQQEQKQKHIKKKTERNGDDDIQTYLR